MNWTRLTERPIWSLVILLMAAFGPAAVAQDASQKEFQRGYFLQTHEGGVLRPPGPFNDRNSRIRLKAQRAQPLALRFLQCSLQFGQGLR